MAQPSTPGGPSIFGPGAPPSSANQSVLGAGTTPGSAASSNNTFLMPNSPVKGRLGADGYRPKVTRTLGQRPACLVNASVTYCGNNQIYAFGGFDQYTDEVYNHVLKLDMVSHQWSLVDNYGDIPGVRMGMLSKSSMRLFTDLQQVILRLYIKETNCSYSVVRTNIEPTSLTSSYSI